MSVKSNLAIVSVGNVGSGFFKNLAPPIPVINGFAEQVIFTFTASQVGLSQIIASVNLQAGDATTQINRFRIKARSENGGISLQDYITTPTILPQVNPLDVINTATFFRLVDLNTFPNDSDDEVEIVIYCDYQGNTAPLLVGGQFQSIKLI